MFRREDVVPVSLVDNLKRVKTSDKVSLLVCQAVRVYLQFLSLDNCEVGFKAIDENGDFLSDDTIAVMSLALNSAKELKAKTCVSQLVNLEYLNSEEWSQIESYKEKIGNCRRLLINACLFTIAYYDFINKVATGETKYNYTLVKIDNKTSEVAKLAWSI